MVHSGLSVKEALAATSDPVAVSQMYRLVAREKKSITEVAQHETARFLKKDISTDTSSDVSSLSPISSPSKRKRRKKAHTGSGFATVAATCHGRTLQIGRRDENCGSRVLFFLINFRLHHPPSSIIFPSTFLVALTGAVVVVGVVGGERGDATAKWTAAPRQNR